MKLTKIFSVILGSIFFALSIVSCSPESGSVAATMVEDSDLENMNALQFTKVMGNGINLGNAMEATSQSYPGYNSSDASIYETMWGNSKIDSKIFVEMKSAGFDSVRIPVAWTNTMDWSRDDFEINANYLERVAEVVDMALHAGLFVIINDHWDYGWWGLFSHNETLAWKIYEAIWNQVGNYFKDYSYYLIFEGGNEELGDRLNDAISSETDKRLDSSIDYKEKGTLSESQCYEKSLEINQKFVDIIRGQGGNNPKRFLLIPGYDTDFDKTSSPSYKMPSDSTNPLGKLIVSVHYYTPPTYALVSDETNSWGYMGSWPSGSWTESLQNSYFAKLERFVKAGYGVIIGEYAVAPKSDGTKKDGMEKWMKNILDNCDKYNYSPFLWDTGTFFKKDTNKKIYGFNDSEVAAVYKNRNYESENQAN